MPKLAEFERYIDQLCEVLGHQDRHAGFADYSRGVDAAHRTQECGTVGGAHGSVACEFPTPISAPLGGNVGMVGQGGSGACAQLGDGAAWTEEQVLLDHRRYRFSEKRGDSVGVARQYCGQLGKQDNCQVAVSLSLATEQGSVPIEFQLYLPEKWAKNQRRRKKAGVPREVKFLTKPEIALEQIRAAKAAGVVVGIVLADAAYGNETAWREGLSEIELEYCVGVQSNTTVWLAGTGPLPPKPRKKMGRPPTRWRRGVGAWPVSVKAVAESLKARRWHTVSWREGSHAVLSSRFAALRVRAAHRDEKRKSLREEQWLLIEWPRGEAEPTKYWLSTLLADTPLIELVRVAKMRWRIERDYQELKQEFGLSHYEGRNWRGFHHHATLCIAAYGFLLADRLKHGASKKNSSQSKIPSLPANYTPRGSPTRATSRARSHRRHCATVWRGRSSENSLDVPAATC